MTEPTPTLATILVRTPTAEKRQTETILPDLILVVMLEQIQMPEKTQMPDRIQMPVTQPIQLQMTEPIQIVEAEWVESIKN